MGHGTSRLKTRGIIKIKIKTNSKKEYSKIQGERKLAGPTI